MKTGPDRAAQRRRVLLVLAAVLALDTADKGTVGAVAAELEHQLHLGHVQIGLLATVSAIVGAIATVPVGMLTDRINRVRLLTWSVVLWSASIVACGAATSLTGLLLARVALGAVTATAGPTLASIIGDMFEARERGRVWGVVLSGELIGAGTGLVASGALAGVLSWRWAFWWLALPGVAIALALRRVLPEPARRTTDPGATTEAPEGGQLARELVRRADVPPRRELILRGDPTRMPLLRAVRYVLSIPTNVLLIVASSLGYFFFAGLQVFVVVLMRSRYDLGQSAASGLLGLAGLGAVAGVVAGGRIADRLLRSGHIAARVHVAAAAYVLAIVAFLPALASHDLAVAMPFYVVGAAGLSAANAPLSAARLDIMHGRLWGRAEAVRTVAQLAAIASAPLLFGFVANLLGGALAPTFAIMLVPLGLSALMLWRAGRTYPRDVATAAASADAPPERHSAGHEQRRRPVQRPHPPAARR